MSISDLLKQIDEMGEMIKKFAEKDKKMGVEIADDRLAELAAQLDALRDRIADEGVS